MWSDTYTTQCDQSSPGTVYSVSGLNQMVQCLLEDAFLSVWVEGEVSNLACPRSGHWYFSLKDSRAQVRCVLFQGSYRYKDLQLHDGVQILVRAKISLYSARGEFQLVIDHLELAGEGALRKAFEVLKAKLSAEGLFDERHKRPLPKFPKTIGVITSDTGAVLRDICTVLKRRFPAIGVIVYPCLVQGKTAPAQIIRQIQLANQRIECDLLILARGGGSLEDLWPFNEENVARAIFRSVIPLISAIGHETDFTIADFVADCRAATPSMAAQLASPDVAEYQRQLTKTAQRLLRCTQYRLRDYQQRLYHLNKRLRHPRQHLQDNARRLDDLSERLELTMKTQLRVRQQKLLSLSRTLHAVSPLSSLARGYALIQHIETKQIIRATADTQVGDEVHARLKDGTLVCQVKGKLPVKQALLSCR